MKKNTLLPCILAVLTFSCHTPEELIPTEANLRKLETYESALSTASNGFAVDLFRQLSQGEGKNLFFSPFSIHQALSMAMNGNTEPVLEEYRQLLHYENSPLEEINAANYGLTNFLLQVDPQVKFDLANGIWYKEGYQVKPTFKESMTRYYHAEVSPLEMSRPDAAHVINHWVEQKTNGIIKDILDKTNPDAVMYLVNAIYFKGDWKFEFDQAGTKEEPFHLRSGITTPVAMMSLKEQTALKFLLLAPDVSYLELPYSTGQYVMGILASKNPEILSEQLRKLDKEQLDRWSEQSSATNVLLKMPKFKMKEKIENLKNDLIDLGLVTPFSFHEKNFTNLFDNPTDLLKITRVIHDAGIEVDEKGTEATAATVVEVVERLSAAPSGPLEITLDHPFAFWIKEQHSGAILFMGVLENPNLQNTGSL